MRNFLDQGNFVSATLSISCLFFSKGTGSTGGGPGNGEGSTGSKGGGVACDSPTLYCVAPKYGYKYAFSAPYMGIVDTNPSKR